MNRSRLKSGRIRRRATLSLLFVLCSLAITGGILAQFDSGYDLSWNTVDGGGYTWSEGGDYALGSTIGQPDAGVALTGGDYTLAGGFWGGTAAWYRLYLPLLLRNF